MGTRGIMGIRIDGRDKFAYNHFDSYPSGLGDAIVKDIRKIQQRPYSWEWLEGKARALKTVKENTKPSPTQQKAFSRYADVSVSRQSRTDWYCLLRNLQGDLIGTLEAGIMVDSKDFIYDSLFCEWAYVVNIDDALFEIYKGFQQEKHSSGRYARHKVMASAGSTYYPCALISTFSLAQIPNDWQQQVEESTKGEK